MTPEIPDGPGRIGPGWLGRVLGRPVGGLKLQRIGEDESFSGGGLFRLRFDGGSLIAKLSPSEPRLRAAFAGANAREVAFYTRFGAGMPVPACSHGAFDAETGASVLLLQDLGGHRARRFVDGFGVAEAAALLRALARIHAAWWGAPEVAGLAGIATVREFDFAAHWAGYPGAVAALLPDVVLPRAFLALGDHVAANQDAVFGPLLEEAPLTLLHRDCHADNVMFGPDGAAVLLDWQLTGKGRGAWDAAYALISSMAPDQRRRHEHALLRAYHAALVSGGVTGYGWRDCWRDYRLAGVGKLFVTVVATVMLDNAGAAKSAWRRADLQRLLAFCADHRIAPVLFPA